MNNELPALALYFRARRWTGEPYNAEPDEHLDAKWIPINQLPDRFVSHARLAIDHIQNGSLMSEFPRDYYL